MFLEVRMLNVPRRFADGPGSNLGTALPMSMPTNPRITAHDHAHVLWSTASIFAYLQGCGAIGVAGGRQTPGDRAEGAKPWKSEAPVRVRLVESPILLHNILDCSPAPTSVCSGGGIRKSISRSRFPRQPKITLLRFIFILL